MKTPHDNSRLDNFLRDALKNLDVQYQQSDWSDMESMLGPAQKPIDFNISKKTILISASVLLIVVIGIIISQTVHFGGSDSEELVPQNVDSSHSLLNAAGTQQTTTVTVTNSGAPAIDSAAIKSSALMRAAKIADSLKAIASADTTSAQRLTDKEKNTIEKNNKKQDKKQKKNNPADSSSAKTNTIPIPPVDTVSKRAVQEIKVITPPAPADSVKSSEPGRKSRKNRRQKNSSADSSKAKTPAQAKPDSLK